MASRLRRRSASQLSPEEDSLLQTINSQDEAVLRGIFQRNSTALSAIFQMEDRYPERFVLYVAWQLESDGKPVTGTDLYTEVERRAGQCSEIFMNKLRAQTFSKTFTDITERKTTVDSNSSATSFRGACHLPTTTDITTPGPAAGNNTSISLRQNGQSDVTQPLNTPQYALTESNGVRAAANVVNTNGAAGGVTAVKGARSRTNNIKRNNPQQENSLLSPGYGRGDVDVDGAVQGHVYEDEVDNVAPRPGITPSRPLAKTGGYVTSMKNSMAKGREFSEELQDVGMKAALIRECLFAVTGEHKILESYRLCTVCGKSPRNITFLPCGHFTTCRECAGPIYVCGLCGKNVLATVDTFLS